MSAIAELGHLEDAKCKIEEVVTMEGKETTFPSLILTVSPIGPGPSIPGTEERYRIYINSRGKMVTLLRELRKVLDELESS